MIYLQPPDHGVGSLIYVLSRHRDWGTPSLTLTMVMGIVWKQGDISYRFAALDEMERVISVFSKDQGEIAHQSYRDACEHHRETKDRSRSE